MENTRADKKSALQQRPSQSAARGKRIRGMNGRGNHLAEEWEDEFAELPLLTSCLPLFFHELSEKSIKLSSLSRTQSLNWIAR
jgi:hypothetical protein